MNVTSDFCKMDLRMGNVKVYDFVKDYFVNPKILVDAIREYRRVANIPKGGVHFSSFVEITNTRYKVPFVSVVPIIVPLCSIYLWCNKNVFKRISQ